MLKKQGVDFQPKIKNNGKKKYAFLDSLGPPLSFQLCPTPWSICKFKLQGGLQEGVFPPLKIKIHKTKTNTARFAIFCMNSHAIPLFLYEKKITPPPLQGRHQGGGPPSENKKIIKRKLKQTGLQFFACRVMSYPYSFPGKIPPLPPSSGVSLGGGSPL